MIWELVSVDFIFIDSSKIGLSINPIYILDNFTWKWQWSSILIDNKLINFINWVTRVN